MQNEETSARSLAAAHSSHPQPQLPPPPPPCSYVPLVQYGTSAPSVAPPPTAQKTPTKQKINDPKKKKHPSTKKAKKATGNTSTTTTNNNGNSGSDKSELELALLRGVTVRPSGKWQAQIHFQGKSRYIGIFLWRNRSRNSGAWVLLGLLVLLVFACELKTSTALSFFGTAVSKNGRESSTTICRRMMKPVDPAAAAAAATATQQQSLEWKPLDPESLVAAPCLIDQTLCCYNDEDDQPQLAKDVDYAKAVLEAWKEQDVDAAWRTEWASVAYRDDNDKTPLYGHLVRSSERSDDGEDAAAPAAGILLLHTGAGPHDLFLLWKAAALVNTLSHANTNSNNVVVLIADLLSDESGWAWDSDDRSRYVAARKVLLRVKEETRSRPVLESRLRAAVACLQHQLQLEQLPGGDDGDDPQPQDQRTNNNIRIAALGWCFGGHAVAELARLRLPTVRAMATFHGVFDGIPAIDDSNDNDTKPISSEILICHGVQDPFVPSADLEKALATFQHYGHTTSLLQLKDARHGFTNPAQDFNDNEAFAFHAESADKAWRQTVALLQRRLFAAAD